MQRNVASDFLTTELEPQAILRYHMVGDMAFAFRINHYIANGQTNTKPFDLSPIDILLGDQGNILIEEHD